MPTRTVLVVYSPGLALAVVAGTLRSVPRLNVVGPVADAAAVPQCLPSDPLDVVLAEWDEQQPLLRQVIDALRCRHAFPAVILLGQQVELCDLLAMRALGIAGYLSWADLDPMTVRWAIRAAIAGYFVLGPHVGGLTVRSLLPQARSSPTAPSLSNRELVVLRGLSAGLSEQQLAEAAGVGPRTIKRTVMALKAKLDAPSLPSLLLKAGRANLV
jgi:DNA-binding NarL/FixJ family response regulator